MGARRLLFVFRVGKIPSSETSNGGSERENPYSRVGDFEWGKSHSGGF